jgi:RluA family pseudouridine synthase
MFTNIAAYCFAPLNDLKQRRSELQVRCRELGLKGTVLLSTEGINLFVAGLRGEIDRFLETIRQVPGLESLDPKFSESAEQPFTRMLVKIKKEIIAFGVDGVDPARQPAPRVRPRELKQWLDEGRPITLLDTRNDFEVRLGTFRGAVSLGIDHFREFADAARRLTQEESDRPVVTFCTGGIRCEKAAPYLMKLGMSNVFQLDGGILKYFEECGGEHFDGECFVFDKRVGLAADLEQSGHGFCHACQAILTPDELDDERMVAGVSCPRCYRSPEETRLEELGRRREKLRAVLSPLPGSTAMDNYRPLKIHARHDGWKILDFLCDVLGQFSREYWEASCRAGNVVDGEHSPVSMDRIVHPGERYYTRERGEVEPAVSAAIEIMDEDDALIVINKPAPLPTHPSGRFHRNTLEWILRQVYLPQKPRPAHRLDANTSGVVLFTRKSAYARLVQPQFERGEVRKDYLARVMGHPPADRFSCQAPLAAADGYAGAREVSNTKGLPASTDFEVLARFDDDSSLLWVRPHTGRTHQIRVHLAYLGWPIVGETTYSSAGAGATTTTANVTDGPLCLHSWRLQLKHPLDRREVTWEAPSPVWVPRNAEEILDARR